MLFSGSRSIEEFHDEVDRRVAEVLSRLPLPLRCRRGCVACCEDDLTMFVVEAERIRRDFPDLLAYGEPYPPGACAFLHAEGYCRIYQARPYVCRTQGLPLRWLEGDWDGDRVEYRDICPLNDDPEHPLEALPVEACWTIGPAEEALRRLARDVASGAGDLPRIPFRALFRRANYIEPTHGPLPFPFAGG